MTVEHPILAIDHGDARIGLAATDDLAIAAHPAGTIYLEKEEPLAKLREIIASRRVKTLLLGLPLRLDGSEGESAKKVQAFGRELAEAFPELPLLYQDETYTTSDAAAKLRLSGKKSKQQKDLIDQAAALEILQRYLNW